MAATTTQLGLVTPTQGDLTGTWGNVVNNGITEYTNIAIAGTLSFAGDGAVTLANTTGNASTTNIGSTTAQYMVIRVTGTLTTTKIITGPSYSKLYLVDNAATGSTVTFKAAGQTGVIVAAGEASFVYFNGTDYIKVTSDLLLGGYTTTATAAGTTTLTAASTTTQFFTGATTQTIVLPVTSTLVLGAAFSIHNNSTGDLTVNSSGSNLVTTITPNTTCLLTCILITGTTAASWDVDFTGFTTSLPVARGGTGLTTGTSGGVLAFTAAGTLASSTALTASALVIGGGAGAAPSTTTTAAGALTFLGTPSSANLATMVTDETGSGLLVFNSAPALTNPTVTNYVETPFSANSSTAITIALTNGTVQIITLTGNATITMPTATSGKSFIMFLKQDATGGRTVTWSTVKWPGGTAPTLTSTASRQDILSFFADGTNWYGVTVAQNYTP